MVLRDLSVMNHHSHGTHAEVRFENVRVPVANLLATEGSGFALAQARLGPGRIHHCMRSIGQAQLALDMMSTRPRPQSLRQISARARRDPGNDRALAL
jgi:acyl-CoA dehydrogenase